MNHWWLLISEILWHSHESKFTTSAQVILLSINHPPEIIVPGPNAMGLMCTKLTATGDFVTMTMSTYPSLSGCSAIPEKEEGTEWLLLVPSTRSKPRPGCAASRSWYSYTRPRVGSLFWYTEKRMHACGQYHNDVMTWKRFPHYWPFVRGIRRSQDSLIKGKWRGVLTLLFIVSLNRMLNKRSSCWPFKTPWRSRDATVMTVGQLTHWGRVTHICVANLVHHWFS